MARRNDAVQVSWERVTLPSLAWDPSRSIPDVFDEAGRALYPYAVNDRLTQRRGTRDVELLVLENRHLRVSLAPDFGARVFQCVDRATGRDALYVPDMVKPGMVGKTGAWIPGGIEFNLPTGHHEDTLRRVPVTVLDAGPARAVARATRTCRRTGLRMTVDTALAADEARFTTRVVLENPTALPRDWSYWANAAIEAGPDWRFCCAGSACLASEPTAVFDWPVIDGEDAAWLRHAWTANDRFLLGVEEDFFGCYDHTARAGLLHCADRKALPGKKFFTWGHRQPLHQAATMFSDRPRHYVEIQAGAQPTQHHRDMLAPGARRVFASTWAPYREAGELTWTDGALVMGMRDGRPVFVALRPLRFTFRADDRSLARSLAPGAVWACPWAPADGVPCVLEVDGVPARAFVWPFEGRTDPAAVRAVARTMAERRRPARSSAQRLRSARRLLAGGREARGRELLAEVLAVDPGNDTARRLYAESAWRSGLFDEGRAALAAMRTPAGRRRAARMLTQESAAREDFEALVRAGAAADASPTLQHGEALAGRGAGDAALPLLRRAARRSADAPRAHLALARHAWRLRGARAPARRHLRAALAPAPDDPELLQPAAELLVELGDFEALADLLAGAPRRMRAWSGYAQLRALADHERGDLEAAWRTLARRTFVPWECETRWYLLYRDCAVDRVREALAAHAPARARRRLAAVGAYPERFFIAPPVWSAHPVEAYWRGVLLRHAGRADAAREAFAAGAAVAVDAPRHALRLGGDVCVYHVGLCSAALTDDGQPQSDVLARIRRALDQREADYGPAPALLRGQWYSLAGDFAAAADCFARAMRAGGPTRRAREHHAAARRGRHWGLG